MIKRKGIKVEIIETEREKDSINLIFDCTDYSKFSLELQYIKIMFYS